MTPAPPSRTDREDAGPTVVQVALCSLNLPRTVAVLSALGFRDAGGRSFAGSMLAEVQRLGDDAATVLWWLVGPQPFVQIEVFQHTDPDARPLPADHRPCDIGWARWGVAVADLDGALDALRAHGVDPTARLTDAAGVRHATVVEPSTRVPLHLREQPDATDGPRLTYVAVSVPDLDAARELYVERIGMPETTPPTTDAHQPLWGLTGATSRRFAVDGGPVALEVVEYLEPRGRPLPADHRLSDQGLMHAAIGFRDKRRLERLADRLVAAGHPLTAPLPVGPSGGTYLDCGDGLTLELFAAPPEHDAGYGFVPVPPPPFVAD
jgi:catechol 2,3-dioxygenase-like lactoylglutathione lyase family enzyme